MSIKVVHIHSCTFRVSFTKVEREQLNLLKGQNSICPDEMLNLIIERGLLELTGVQPEKRS